MKVIKRSFFCVAFIALFFFISHAYAWVVHAKWECCGPNPKERVQIRCKNGFVPTFVKVDGKWYIKKAGGPDGVGTAYPTLEAGAKDFCKE